MLMNNFGVWGKKMSIENLGIIPDNTGCRKIPQALRTPRLTKLMGKNSYFLNHAVFLLGNKV